MPKAKPDKVIVHHIELQETERATVEAALAGQFVTNAAMAGGNLLKGVGAALASFTGALTALAAVWIAERSWDELKDKVLDPIVDYIQRPHLEMYADDYSMIVAWLNAQYAMQGWGFLQTDNSSVEAYVQSAEAQSVLWRQGGIGNHPTLGSITELSPGTNYDMIMPSWLVDRFDMFIYTMKGHTATAKELKTPAEWWVQFYSYAEFENEIIWYAKNR